MQTQTLAQKPRNGFTIVELLIVIVIIAVLAAITIVAFNGIQQRARQSKLSSDIANIKKAMELYKIKNGDYPYCPDVNGAAVTECRFSPSIRDQLAAEGQTNLPTYSYSYVHINSVTWRDRWAMRHYSDGDYKGVSACKFGVSVEPTWYGSIPECT